MFGFKKDGSKDSNKRQHKRVDFFQSSYYLVMAENRAPASSECWFTNISAGGLSFDTKKTDITEGDEVKVLYKIGTKFRNDRLNVRFIRKSLDSFKCGCEFIEPDTERSDLIKNMITH
ncbi:MAG: PilZ domain-containing protein [Spirochaetes bacterium]|jgi:hypothetical protein|nr:PilZ domain-containing protein [Spirochaetota bacterium]